ncbi:MAG TPA: hypothetical protein VNY32_07470, partial [Candidatus Acidoferrales bacterium]|nr:hypothetical protein [Candidatus Acidoferrales bacterium]
MWQAEGIALVNHPHDSNAAPLLVPQVRPFCNAAQGDKIPTVVPRVVVDKGLSVAVIRFLTVPPLCGCEAR